MFDPYHPCSSVFIRGKVLANGKEDLLAAVHRAGRADGASPSAMVEPGAYIAAARLLLVDCLSQRMGLVEKTFPPKSFHQLQQEQKSRYSHSHPTVVSA